MTNGVSLVLTTRLVHWLSWVFATQARKKEIKNASGWGVYTTPPGGISGGKNSYKNWQGYRDRFRSGERKVKSTKRAQGLDSWLRHGGLTQVLRIESPVVPGNTRVAKKPAHALREGIWVRCSSVEEWLYSVNALQVHDEYVYVQIQRKCASMLQVGTHLVRSPFSRTICYMSEYSKYVCTWWDIYT